ncbi:shikimate dehydrogenase [Nocardioides sp. GY 10113]|uniref:shikimate dehydrogenase n=1 Tax=Nocardioides sp. GY 10113 TaxID=2569761 RepID=UPI0010A827FA|nr:shikimate dehydrogenase [Nocardioides sp. GY 10113]TIC80365.1 shikimate dehydrogenase [Nocardioides sp. GY 10113]TIC82474.1 shikimate dehydrogenase [Nocardioides sp. GY 10113]
MPAPDPVSDPGAERGGGPVVPRCAVLGDPVAHSLSPTLHRAGYAALGLSASYDAVRVPAGGLAAVLAGLGPDWRGLSVTAPLKREALELAASSTDRARLAGGANTLLRIDGTDWAADNTDLPGAVAAIRERYDGPVHTAVILGAGATAASTGLALAELGARRIVVAARDAGRATPTLAAIAAHPGRPEVTHADLAGCDRGAAEVVVSTIPAAAQEPALVARFADAPVLFEVLYDPWPTPLAAAAGGALVSGLDLLLHQAYLQFEAFTGRAAPRAAMRAAGESALAERAAGRAAAQ